MRKVLIDRELLEYLADLGDEAIERMGSYLAEKHGEQKYVDAARTILAQPAEAEAVDVRKIVVDSLVSMIAGVTRMIPPTDQPLPDFIQAPVDRAVERISAALSAVTAERDRLLAELERAYANYNQVSYASTERGKQIDQLRAEVEGLREERGRFRAEVKSLLDTITAMAEERDRIRVEVEALRSVAREFAGFFSSDEPRHWEFHALADAATMAAKESTHEE